MKNLQVGFRGLNWEIAEEMGISETTVKFHKSVAYRELNKSLGHLFLMVAMLS